MRRIAACISVCALACLVWISSKRTEVFAFQPAIPRIARGADQNAKNASASLNLQLPLLPNSTRFAVIGDFGTGQPREYEIAHEMARYREAVKYEFVIMLGDNIYGGHRPEDFVKKFEQPFQSLLLAGVKFYASLGNHDDPNVERLYKPFNMDGHRYYTFRKGDIDFFALDSNYMDPGQLTWLEEALPNSKGKWKIAFFHHPLYSNGRAHGPDLDLRERLSPLFREYGVNVVFSGHEHVYERIKPEDSIQYFILGNSGKLMKHDLRRSEAMETGFDSDQSFMVVEIAGDTLYFQTISRTGDTVDAGAIQREHTVPAATSNSGR